MVRGTSPRSPLASMEPSSRTSSVHAMAWPSGSLASMVKDTSSGASPLVRVAVRVACGGWLSEGGGAVLADDGLVDVLVGLAVAVLELVGLLLGLLVGVELALGLVEVEGEALVLLDGLEVTEVPP